VSWAYRMAVMIVANQNYGKGRRNGSRTELVAVERYAFS
jgi:hypothetical protein